MEKEIKIWIETLVRRAFSFNLDEESEQICELIGFIKAGQCFLDNKIPTSTTLNENK